MGEQHSHASLFAANIVYGMPSGLHAMRALNGAGANIVAGGHSALESKATRKASAVCDCVDHLPGQTIMTYIVTTVQRIRWFCCVMQLWY